MLIVITRSMLLVTALLISCLCTADDIQKFSSDGCSSFPDGNLEHNQLWLDCCIAHDLSYWQGGTYEQRLMADQQLEVCVSKVGEPAIAALMLAGVRVGGSPYFPTAFRWGYGWPYFRAYQALSDKDQQKITKALSKAVKY